MCSTSKVLAAAALLGRVYSGMERLDRRVGFTTSDQATYSPVTKDHAGDAMPLADLFAAAITITDSTAGNLMPTQTSGPNGVNRCTRDEPRSV